MSRSVDLASLLGTGRGRGWIYIVTQVDGCGHTKCCDQWLPILTACPLYPVPCLSVLLLFCPPTSLPGESTRENQTPFFLPASGGRPQSMMCYLRLRRQDFLVGPPPPGLCPQLKSEAMSRFGDVVSSEVLWVSPRTPAPRNGAFPAPGLATCAGG